MALEPLEMVNRFGPGHGEAPAKLSALAYASLVDPPLP